MLFFRNVFCCLDGSAINGARAGDTSDTTPIYEQDKPNPLSAFSKIQPMTVSTGTDGSLSLSQTVPDPTTGADVTNTMTVGVPGANGSAILTRSSDVGGLDITGSNVLAPDGASAGNFISSPVTASSSGDPMAFAGSETIAVATAGCGTMAGLLSGSGVILRRLCMVGAATLMFVSSVSSGRTEDLRNNTEFHFRTEAYVNAIAWSPDGRYLAASDMREHALYEWDTTSGELVFRIKNSAASNKGIVFTDDGNFVLCSASDGLGILSFTVFLSKNGEKFKDALGPSDGNGKRGSNSAKFLLRSHDGQVIYAIFSGGGGIGIFDANIFNLLSTIELSPFQPTGAVLDTTGNFLTLSSYDGFISLF